ncbi:MAG TPA: SpoIIE family protein phosphatase [Solirubrobacterales bacterium]|nr:SpoIIE family protein phosphatase [Solirubrobacterales bacterium]
MEKPQEMELWRYLRSQRELAARLIEGDSLEEVAPRFLEIVAGLLRWEVGGLWEVTDEEEPLRLVSGWSAPDLDASKLWQRSREIEFRRGTGLPGDAWASGEIALAPDYRAYPTPTPRFEVTAELGLSAALAIPVPIGDSADVLAVAEFHTRAFNPQSEELMALLTGFADQLGTFIARRRAEAKSAEAERFRQHLAEVVRGTQDAVLSKDLGGYVTTWNPAAERLYGYTAEEAIGRHVSFIVPPDHKDEEMVILDRVKQGERLDTYETERIRADGARISVSLTVSPIRSPRRGLIGASVVARDITAEMRRRRAQEFLVAASRLLDSSLDPVETARTIVSTAVPELAELCLIDFRRPDGWLGDSVVAGANPEMAERLELIRREQPLDPNGEHPVAQVLRLERPMIWRDLKAPEVVDKVAQGPEHLQLMVDAGYNSAAVVPLTARGRSLGAISFLHAAGDLRYDPGDLEFLSELGERAALALDNARLYRERDRVAKNLQRGLRPPRPAEIPGLDIAVVFEAAGEGIEVGGDLYDVLPTPDGCWIVVGDVSGKGSAAAGVSVAIRHSVRGLAQEDAEPDEVLFRVNELLLGGDTLNDFATAMLARLRRDRDGWHAVVASAGHPPAVQTTPQGPRLLGGGSVLGAWPEARVERHQCDLGPDSTLVLCTDGWHEAGPVANHQDPAGFAAMAQSLAGLELDEMIERLRADAVSRSAGVLRDDLVLLAIRPRDAAAETAAAEAAGGIAVGSA